MLRVAKRNESLPRVNVPAVFVLLFKSLFVARVVAITQTLTTAQLNPHWFARGYVAYGTKDEKVKYSGEVEYSFNKKKFHSREFPINSIKLSHSYDIDQLGQHYLYTNKDNVFLSLKRKGDNKATYLRKT